MKNKIIGVIPSRYAASRFPGKPLALLNGTEMIAWVIRGAKTAKKLHQVLVATDDERIAAVAQREGALVAMTDSELPSGTDRIWAAVKDLDCDVIINIQGDEPLVDGTLIDHLVAPFEKDQALQMATLAHAISPEELISPHAVKVIVDQQGNAIYFSRFSIPYSKDNAKHTDLSAALKHIGMYGYRKSFLKSFCAAPQAEIEKAESLEQLRALAIGARIKVVIVEDQSWGVDTPDDLAKIEQILRARR
jgi:3-deoxy-manno-octulosonate cytidylyltransferase (CMP-KDO synthetase)